LNDVRAVSTADIVKIRLGSFSIEDHRLGGPRVVFVKDVVPTGLVVHLSHLVCDSEEVEIGGRSEELSKVRVVSRVDGASLPRARLWFVSIGYHRQSGTLLQTFVLPCLPFVTPKLLVSTISQGIKLFQLVILPA